MIRTLLATTAVAALLAGSAFAQDASSSAPEAPAMSSEMPMTTESSAPPVDASSMAPAAPAETTATPATRTPVNILSGYTTVDTDHLATKVIGQSVYDGAGAEANDLGKINDLVLDRNGDIAAVVLGVGGFLGIGEKQVAVDYSALEWASGPDGAQRFVLKTTKEELTSAPDFKTVDAAAPAADMAPSSAAAQ